jgi:hypothetical protein
VCACVRVVDVPVCPDKFVNWYNREAECGGARGLGASTVRHTCAVLPAAVRRLRPRLVRPVLSVRGVPLLLLLLLARPWDQG